MLGSHFWFFSGSYRRSKSLVYAMLLWHPLQDETKTPAIFSTHRIHVWYMLTFGVYWWQMLPYIAYMDPMGYGTWTAEITRNSSILERTEVPHVGILQPERVPKGFFFWGTMRSVPKCHTKGHHTIILTRSHMALGHHHFLFRKSPFFLK